MTRLFMLLMMACTSINLVSFNLHGFNQGFDTVKEIIDVVAPDCIMLQEHWLVGDQIAKLEACESYFCVSGGAMRKCVEMGPLYGRPAGGIAILIRDTIAHNCKIIEISDRFICVLIGSVLLFNVYLPCQGTVDRLLVLNEVLSDISNHIRNHPNSECILCGDFNVDLYSASSEPCLLSIKQFVSDHSLACAYDFFPSKKFTSFTSKAHYSESLLDYFFASGRVKFSDIYTFDGCFNFSDHVPVICTVNNVFGIADSGASCGCDSQQPDECTVRYCRWDKADLQSYYEETRVGSSLLYEAVCSVDVDYVNLAPLVLRGHVDAFIDELTSVLLRASAKCIPSVKKGVYKFWWDEELRALKEDSINSHREWVLSGRPRSGVVADRRNSSRLKYRAAIRNKRLAAEMGYSDKLNDYLSSKDNVAFWKAWKSKFGKEPANFVVDGSCDNGTVVNSFRTYFESIQNPPINKRDELLQNEYLSLRQGLENFPKWRGHIDSGLLDRLVCEFKAGKSPGPDGITAEHIKFAHPVVVSIFSKIFNWIMLLETVPNVFCCSYSVPIPKGGGCSGNITKCSDFRGIAISSVVSKLFESALLHIYREFFVTDSSQFGFKKNHSCSSAIYCARETINKFVSGGDTANVLALDISKAFPRVNHYALLIKLIKSGFPVTFIDLMHNWLSSSSSQVKWKGLLSGKFYLRTGVNQGCVLSPCLFALCMNDLIRKCKALGLGVVLVYADDVLIIARTLKNLQLLFNNVLQSLQGLNLDLNVDKTCFLRIGNRFDSQIVDVCTLDGLVIRRTNVMRYLGVYLLASRIFKCCASMARKSFNKACNAILSKLLGRASEEVIVHLVKTKCYPILLYGSEVCNFNASTLHSMDFSVVRFIMKIFRTGNRAVALECLKFVNFTLPSVAVRLREAKFMKGLNVNNDTVYRLSLTNELFLF